MKLKHNKLVAFLLALTTITSSALCSINSFAEETTEATTVEEETTEHVYTDEEVELLSTLVDDNGNKWVPHVSDLDEFDFYIIDDIGNKIYFNNSTRHSTGIYSVNEEFNYPSFSNLAKSHTSQTDNIYPVFDDENNICSNALGISQLTTLGVHAVLTIDSNLKTLNVPKETLLYADFCGCDLGPENDDMTPELTYDYSKEVEIHYNGTYKELINTSDTIRYTYLYKLKNVTVSTSDIDNILIPYSLEYENDLIKINVNTYYHMTEDEYLKVQSEYLEQDIYELPSPEYYDDWYKLINKDDKDFEILYEYGQPILLWMFEFTYNGETYEYQINYIDDDICYSCSKSELDAETLNNIRSSIDDKEAYAMFTVMFGNMLTDSEQSLGDINADDIIDVRDVVQLNKAILGIETLSKDSESAADVNGDGSIDSADSLLLMKYCVGLITSL